MGGVLVYWGVRVLVQSLCFLNQVNGAWLYPASPILVCIASTLAYIEEFNSSTVQKFNGCYAAGAGARADVKANLTINQ